jgi:hypothetical protein
VDTAVDQGAGRHPPAFLFQEKKMGEGLFGPFHLGMLLIFGAGIYIGIYLPIRLVRAIIRRLERP